MGGLERSRSRRCIAGRCCGEPSRCAMRPCSDAKSRASVRLPWSHQRRARLLEKWLKIVAPIDMSISTSGFSVGKKLASAGPRSALKMVQRPLRQDRLPKRIDKPTPDQDQDYPYQIIDLFSEVGHGLRPLQLPHEYGSQEENDRYRSQNDSYQLIHGESSQILRWPTYFTGGRFALDRVSLREQIAAAAQSLLATTSQRRIHTRPCASRQGALEVAAAHMAPATWLPKWSVRWDRGPTARRTGDVPAADERNLEKVRNAHYILWY